MLLGRARTSFSDQKELNTSVYNEIHHSMNIYSMENGFLTDWGDPIDHLLANIRNFPSLTINAFGDILLSPYIPIAFGNICRASLEEYLEKDIFKYWDSDVYCFLRSKLVNYDKMDACKILGISELNEGVVLMDILDDSVTTKLDALYMELKEKTYV